MVYKDGKYFVEMEGRDEELPVGVLVDEAQFKELVGQQVEVLYSEPTRFVVGVVARVPRIRCYYILCYYPADIWGRYVGPAIPELGENVRIKLADRFLEEGLISREVHEKLTHT
jgi:hypothetical protein